MDISTTPTAAQPREAAAAVVAPVDVTVVSNSFEDFYRDSAPTVSRALAATLNDPELATDATNEAMTRAYERWAKISKYDNPSAWVYRVGLNWSLSWKRKRRRERERPVKFSPDQVELNTRDSSLDGALSALSMDQRAVVICRIHMDWSIQQTSEALEIAPGTVQSRLSRAITNLRSSMEGELA